MLTIALTGGIASGKTSASDHFHLLGVPIVDADVLAREVVAPGTPGLAALVNHFGDRILDDRKELDRVALRSIIFSDKKAKQTVDNILHPLIRQLSDQKLGALRNENHAYAIYAIPLLVETAQQDRFDRIVVVDVSESVQINRLTARDGGSEVAARKILATQASREARLAVADDVIDNNGSIDELKHQVEMLHKSYCALAQAAHSKNRC